MCVTPSPEMLKVTTPKRKYGDGQIRNPIAAQLNFESSTDSPTFPTTPTTKAWVSELINLPSSMKKSNSEMCIPKKMITKNILLKKIRKMKLILKEKQIIINSLKKKEQNK